jgi:hypothetical protein
LSASAGTQPKVSIKDTVPMFGWADLSLLETPKAKEIREFLRHSEF